MKRNGFFVVFLIVLLMTAFAGIVSAQDLHEIDALTGATPRALKKEMPEMLSLYVDGRVMQPYRYGSRQLAPIATARFRDVESTPMGDILGAYIYTGIPLLYILEKTTPYKKETDVFDRPLDMVVVLYSHSGKKVYFSYGELTMVDDLRPVMLAYNREPVLPAKDADSYSKNKLKGNVHRLRLICAKETDNSRYLEDTVQLYLKQPIYPESLLPKVQKKKDCTASVITCIEEGKTRQASFKGVPKHSVTNWVRIGHGRGIKDEKATGASGFHLRTFLARNFPGCNGEDFFLFVGCDGYRALFSGREIFNTDDGDRMLLLDSIGGKPLVKNFTLGPMADFFIDRHIRGLSHVVRIKDIGGMIEKE